jgi:hypothetical protein
MGELVGSFLARLARAQVLERGFDIREDVANGRAEQDQDANDHHGNQCDDEGILNEPLTTITAE